MQLDPNAHPPRIGYDALVARFEAAAEFVGLSVEQWAILLGITMPEWYSDAPATTIPTTSGPGTDPRITAMTERHAAGLNVFHPADAKELSGDDELTRRHTLHDPPATDADDQRPPRTGTSRRLPGMRGMGRFSDD